MINVAPPLIPHMGKGLVKASEMYLSDSGIVRALLGLNTFEDMMGHPGFGSLWGNSGFV